MAALARSNYQTQLNMWLVEFTYNLINSTSRKLEKIITPNKSAIKPKNRIQISRHPPKLCSTRARLKTPLSKLLIKTSHFVGAYNVSQERNTGGMLAWWLAVTVKKHYTATHKSFAAQNGLAVWPQCSWEVLTRFLHRSHFRVVERGKSALIYAADTRGESFCILK